MKTLIAIALLLLTGIQHHLMASEPSARTFDSLFLENYCWDCHDSATKKGKVDLESLSLDWSSPETGQSFETILAVLKDGYMPPPRNSQPSAQEKSEFTKEIHALLSKNTVPGGTLLRRLNRSQYESTIDALFAIKFKAPPSFPPDPIKYGFDNIADGMQLSPPLMKQYLNIATDVANRLLPPVSQKKKIIKETVSGNGTIHRLVSSENQVIRSTIGEAQFAAPYSGTYQFKVQARRFMTDKVFYKTHKKYTLQVYATPINANPFSIISSKNLVTEFKLKDNDDWQTFSGIARLEKGSTLRYRWKDGPFQSLPGEKKFDSRILVNRFKQDHRLHHAFVQLDLSIRGIKGADLYKKLQSEMLKSPNTPPQNNLFKKASRPGSPSFNNFVSYLTAESKQAGPGIEVKFISINGPHELFESRAEYTARRITEDFMGEQGSQSEEKWIASILSPFIARAFRRPPTDSQRQRYINIATKHVQEGRSVKDGVHLALRAMLTSPNFLYFHPSPSNGELGGYALAERLSYFLTNRPPDDKLFSIAGKALNDADLKKEATRLLKSRQSMTFISRFTGQWLGGDKLVSIMPDPRLGRFTTRHSAAFKQEAELLFSEILHQNLPMETFIDPDFIHANGSSRIAYPKLKIDRNSQMRKFAIPKGTHQGGVLALPAMLMATSNGVDTEPILRGVWLLENILGEHLPSAPSSVPALVPDTRKATTVLETIKGHTKDPNCRSCHQKIDPLGLLLENYNPIGAWRSHYPRYKQESYFDKKRKENRTRIKRINGNPVHSKGVLPDGTQLNDVVDLKRHLASNIDIFSMCLSEKLMTYATGRRMSYADKLVIQNVVREVRQNGNGFQDLLIGLICSDVFKK